MKNVVENIIFVVFLSTQTMELKINNMELFLRSQS